MMGAGFMKDMNDRLRSNRSLLKGDDSGKYQNFDKSYITDYPTGKTRRIPSYRKATAEYMFALKGVLQNESQTETRRILLKIILSMTITSVIVVFGIFIFNYFFL